MDIDVKLLKGLAQDKEIPFDVLVGRSSRPSSSRTTAPTAATAGRA